MRSGATKRGWAGAVLLTASLALSSVLIGQPAHAGVSTKPAPAAANTEAAPAAAAQPSERAEVRKFTPAVDAAAMQAGRQRHGARVSADQAIRAYWTPERMRAARPAQESPAYAAAVARQASDAGQAQSKRRPSWGRPLTVPPAAGELGTPSAVPAALNPNFPSTHPTARTSGKVFYNLDGGSWVCSATVVNSAGLDSVWTAGHCIHSGAGGSLASNWQFVPGYDDDLANPAPYGTWTAGALWTMTSWINNSDWSSDIGVATMNTSGGVHIVNRLGGQGLRVNQPFNVSINAFGYPAESPYDGGNLRRCSASTSQFEAQTLRMSCDMTRGSSGGAWLLNWDGNWGYLNGVNSRIDRIVNPTIMISPHFDNTALALWDHTKDL